MMFNVKEKEALETIFGKKKAALGVISGGISSKEERTPAKPWSGNTDDSFTVMLFRHLRNGTVFLPIEKLGKTFYFYSRGAGARKYLKDRKWAIGKELYVKASQSVSRSASRDKDGIFGAGTWCVVRKDSPEGRGTVKKDHPRT